jgi:uncharacterized membrane protein
MVVLAGLVFFPISVSAVFGLAMVCFHNLLDGLTAAQVGLPDLLWVNLHSGGEAVVLQGDNFKVTFVTGYCLIPWAGVMTLGHSFGSMLLLPPNVRRREVFALGAMLTLAFLLLRAANGYGDASHWAAQGTWDFTLFSFLNCTKYPPSLLYLLMTLGPALMALALFDNLRGRLLQPLITFGRVPLFFYLLHIPLIHGSAVALDYWRFGWSPLANGGPWDLSRMAVPMHYGVSLPVVYLIWIGVLVVLYLPCRCYAGIKQRHRSTWLGYL